MKILIACDDFSQLTGMPIYIRTLSRELKKRGHEIYIVSYKTGLVPYDEIMQFKYGKFNPAWIKPDVLLLNEPSAEKVLNLYPGVPAYNLIHSPRPEDAPIMRQPQIRKYVAIKKEDHRFILESGIDERFIVDIPQPVDFEYFKPQDVGILWDIASISTIDLWRKPMLKKLIERARGGKRVLILGEDCGGLGDLNQYKNIPTLTIIPNAVPDVRPYIATSGCIAGLFRGLITIEAWAMGKATVQYNLKGQLTDYDETPPACAKVHDARTVADTFEKLLTRKWADIIIPAHDRTDLLIDCIKSIPRLNFNLIVSKTGGSFAQNCNRGAEKALTKQFIFVNEDMVLTPQALWEMMDRTEDIVGGRTIYPNGKPQYIGLGLRWNGNIQQVEYFLSDVAGECTCASGGFFKISRKAFYDAGQPDYSGFSEDYPGGGGEDQDLMMSALSKGYTIGFSESPIIHHLSQSKDRWVHVVKNEALLRSRWLDNLDRLKNIFHVLDGYEGVTYKLRRKKVEK